jgi:hypothetical protein
MANLTCPSCGISIQYTRTGGRDWQTHVSEDYDLKCKTLPAELRKRNRGSGTGNAPSLRK